MLDLAFAGCGACAAGDPCAGPLRKRAGGVGFAPVRENANRCRTAGDLVFGNDPVVGRKIDLPKGWRGLQKLDADLRSSSLLAADVNDAAFMSMASELVGNRNCLAHGCGGGERKQGAVSVDHP